MDYFDTQNEKLYDFLNQTFNINKHKKWDDISKSITKEKVKKTYRLFAKLFPRNINYSEELEKTKESFSSIHCSTLEANLIIDEIVRFSLYSDKILVFHPLQNPAVTSQELDPRNNSKRWLPDFLNALYFYIVIQKWVKAGIVKLIINPCEYDISLRNDIDTQAKKRMLNSNHEEFKRLTHEFSLNKLAQDFAVFLRHKNKDQIVDNLLSLESPIFTETEAEDFSIRIIDNIDNINPLWGKLDKSNYNQNGMISPTKGGGPIESMQYISKITGGNIYTPSKATWFQMKEIGVNDFWSKTNHLYSNIPLNFLNNVDTAFALKIREEDRLFGVRKELKNIYAELNKIDINELDENKIKFIQGNLIEEIKKADSEWNLINEQAKISRRNWAATTSSVGLPLIINEISILPLAISSLGLLYKNEKSLKAKQADFRVQKPLSVYIDLKNKKQNYLTELKNCIL